MNSPDTAVNTNPHDACSGRHRRHRCHLPGSVNPPPPGVSMTWTLLEKTLSLPYNDMEQISTVIKEKGPEIACVIVEPIGGNMGLVPPVEGFLQL